MMRISLQLHKLDSPRDFCYAVKIYPNDFKYAMDANTKLTKAVNILSAFSARKSSIAGLYEIEFLGKNIKLRKVSFE